MTKLSSNNQLYTQVVNLLQSAKDKVLRSVNHTMMLTYFEIGRILVEDEQDGEDRAAYGKEVLSGLSKILKKEFGKGFSVTNLKQMRNLYLIYGKGQTPSDQLPISSTVLPISDSKEKGQTVSDELTSTDSKKLFTNSEIKQQRFLLSWSHYLKLMGIV